MSHLIMTYTRMVLKGCDPDHHPKQTPSFRILPDRETDRGCYWEKSRTCLLSVQGAAWQPERSDVGNPGRNSLLPRHASKPSAHVNHGPAAPTESTRQMRRLISACAGNSSKLSFQQFVKLCMKHKAKDIDGLDPGRENKHTSLPGCCHLILFRGLSDKWMDWGHLRISKVGTSVRISL